MLRSLMAAQGSSVDEVFLAHRTLNTEELSDVRLDAKLRVVFAWYHQSSGSAISRVIRTKSLAVRC